MVPVLATNGDLASVHAKMLVLTDPESSSG